nr:TetR/AcrR family transcriptional regulator [Allonocardiopsis opalescens]
MTGQERREQLLDIGRRLFAERGFDGASVEEIASRAGVSKPVVYEHFGGKEGIYAVVVDREMQRLLDMVAESLVDDHPRVKLERAALALLRYIEESSEGFHILARDSHAASGTGSFASLISDIATQVEHILAEEFTVRGYDPKLAPMYAQSLVGMVALTGQWWLEVRRPKREVVAAHLVNLAWNGLGSMDPKPGLVSVELDRERSRAERAREKEQQREAREQQKAQRQAERQAVRAERAGAARPEPRIGSEGEAPSPG